VAVTIRAMQTDEPNHAAPEIRQMSRPAIPADHFTSSPDETTLGTAVLEAQGDGDIGNNAAAASADRKYSSTWYAHRNPSFADCSCRRLFSSTFVSAQDVTAAWLIARLSALRRSCLP
jgi:hypothetical protein